MTGYPTTPPEDWHPIPVLGPEDPLPADDQDPHLVSPVADGCLAAVTMGMVMLFSLYLVVHVVVAVLRMFI